ncbi:molybdopterin oxidoreductase [Paractinoplanes abujensis]|uniref:Assimilatory nitrate reductase catalytic subunit n=1 Tax=Paractinoplanes abujensis TaxID=882441 RepID=A0A7W7CNP8_9ACTN|nr:molybdopterin oxidoreductase family protein [Actinoplanes abujensis]MBB4691919.1 assimilatory nitrate reductase catalytic subunit [Actinoplanes abujensis]GID16661.1 molybdopterin oxidoreductase [Actinoplanes abujensis]
MTATDTHCPYCALQCGMTLTPEIPRVRLEPRDFVVNKGGLCAKGFSAADLLDHSDRLLTPLVRKGQGLREASWDEAFDRIVDAIESAQKAYGRDSVGAFGGGGLTNEKAYALGKFVRVSLKSSSIDYNGRFCMSSAATAANRSLGVDRGLPFPLEDVASARTVLIVGANPAEAMPPSMQYLEGTRFIVADPRRTKTAAGAYLHLQPLPGTDLALANGLLHIAIREGYVDEDYVARRTTGFEAVRSATNAYWPERVERMTGVPETQLRQTVRLLATEGPAMILTARGAEQHSNGTDTAQAFLNLALALGLVGRPFSGYGTITGQGNGQGGREHGQKADQLPGYRKLDDPAARAHVAAVWGIDPDELPGPGRSAYEMLTDDRLKVLMVLASNIAVSAPNSNRVLQQLRKLDFLVVSDIFLSETAALADVVLPAAQWAEEEGTMTNLEGRVIRRRRALPPPPDVRTDLEVLAELSRRLGRAESSDPRTVFEELRRASAGGIADYAGITYERIEQEDGVFWPCPAEDHPGTPRLFADTFPTPSGKARLIPVVHQDPAEMPDRSFPYVLTTGRNMQHYQSGNQTRRVRALTVALPEPRAEIHPDLARRHGIADGDLVELRSRRGAAVLRARLSDGIRPDTVFAPFHWPGANALTNPALDPHSRMPAFKACAVAISLHTEGTE